VEKHSTSEGGYATLTFLKSGALPMGALWGGGGRENDRTAGKRNENVMLILAGTLRGGANPWNCTDKRPRWLTTGGSYDPRPCLWKGQEVIWGEKPVALL